MKKNIGLANQSKKCLLCNSSQINQLCCVDGYKVYKCKECTFEFVNPSPSSKELKSFYDREEWFEAGEKGGYVNYDEQTQSSLENFDKFLTSLGDGENRSILDVGCGYGSHLSIAKKHGWTCFGVEPSGHAREIAKSRHKLHVVEKVQDLIPHTFDLVIMFDVIEHVASPYEIFYPLFSINAISAKTQIIITTPNAGFIDAQEDPSSWIYRHPPSHLSYYTAEAFEHLFENLLFTEIDIKGTHPQDTPGGNDLSNYNGLCCHVKGSDFRNFMQERYVPYTWSVISAYEHFPRYELSKEFIEDKDVLDFGCGTGYGSATLADAGARSVTGIDIDEKALEYARNNHKFENLNFIRNAQLADDIKDDSFDVITCYEMIEHVGEKEQERMLANFSRLLRNNGIFLGSTPNPVVTAKYGDNPYHIYEMTRDEFEAKLKKYFNYVTIVDQWVSPAVTFGTNSGQSKSKQFSSNKSKALSVIAYIAICSNQKLVNFSNITLYDTGNDLIDSYINNQNRYNATNLALYESCHKLEEQCNISEQEHQKFEQLNIKLVDRDKELERVNVELMDRDKELERVNVELMDRDKELERLSIKLVNREEELERLNNELFKLDDYCKKQSSTHACEQQKLIDNITELNQQLETCTTKDYENQNLIIKLNSLCQDSLDELVALRAASMHELNALRTTQVQEIKQLQLTITSFESSRSWKITKPFRTFTSFLGKFKRFILRKK